MKTRAMKTSMTGEAILRQEEGAVAAPMLGHKKDWARDSPPLALRALTSPHKYIKNTSTNGIILTEHLLNIIRGLRHLKR